MSASAPVQVPQGGAATITGNGTDAPASSLTWDIVQGSTTIATSASPNGWSAAASAPGTATTGSPTFEAAGSYELRTHFSGAIVFSATFDVYTVSYLPKAGTRYLIEANGARIPITAASVQSSGSPTVVCTVPAGYPLYVDPDAVV